MATAEVPDYCLLAIEGLCMPRSDWAAWVQAIGGLIGLVIAIGVPYRINQGQLKRQADTERRMARALSSQVADLLKRLLDVLVAAPDGSLYRYPSGDAWASFLNAHWSLRDYLPPCQEDWNRFRDRLYLFGDLGDRVLAMEAERVDLYSEFSRLDTERAAQEQGTPHPPSIAARARLEAHAAKLAALERDVRALWRNG